jgi:hypothetical protein
LLAAGFDDREHLVLVFVPVRGRSSPERLLPVGLAFNLVAFSFGKPVPTFPENALNAGAANAAQVAAGSPNDARTKKARVAAALW